MLLEAFLTVDWPAFRWLERNLGFLSTVAACDLVHLAGTTVVAAPLSITHYFHSYYVHDTKNKRRNDTPDICVKGTSPAIKAMCILIIAPKRESSKRGSIITQKE